MGMWRPNKNPRTGWCGGFCYPRTGWCGGFCYPFYGNVWKDKATHIFSNKDNDLE